VYLGVVRCALVLFALVFVPAIATACGGAANPPRVSSSVASRRGVNPPLADRAPPAERASASGCRAAPSTIYGDEPVVFDIEGAASTLPVDVELVDVRGQSLAKASAKVPGNFCPNAVPSGDYRLQVGSNGVSCSVTVNRELARGRAAEQK